MIEAKVDVVDSADGIEDCFDDSVVGKGGEVVDVTVGGLESTVSCVVDAGDSVKGPAVV